MSCVQMFRVKIGLAPSSPIIRAIDRFGAACFELREKLSSFE
jgi:hypothetical protein